jgi:hypothetical protein
MKITLRTLVPALASGALARLNRLDLPVRSAHALRTFFKSALAEGTIYDEQRAAMLNKYGEPIPDTNDFKIKNADGYNADLAALLAIEVTVSGAMPTMEEILSAKDGRLHGEDFELLEPLMTQE